jgi:hypothetical protein
LTAKNEGKDTMRLETTTRKAGDKTTYRTTRTETNIRRDTTMRSEATTRSVSTMRTEATMRTDKHGG